MKPILTNRFLAGAAILAAVFALSYNHVRVAVLTWDKGAANLTWGTIRANWTGSTWNNATPDSADFAATGVGTVKLGGPITANSITFDTAGYTESSSPACA